MNQVITIDGSECPLKAEVCRLVAEDLECYWVSTEIIYRGLSFMVIEKQLDPEVIQPILNTIFYDNWEIKIRKEKTHFLYKSVDITERLYAPEITNMTNQLRSDPKIRKHLLNTFRDCAELGKDLVAGGFDCGTYVFPDAVLKIYLRNEHSPAQLLRETTTIDTVGKEAKQIAEQILDIVS